MNFPFEIIIKILNYVSFTDLFNYGLTSKNSLNNQRLTLAQKKLKLSSKTENLNSFIYATTLNLENCRLILDKSLKGLKLIKNINLSGCHGITNKELKYLQKATEINLSGCYKITNKGLKYLKCVKKLNISFCHKITVVGLIHFLRYPEIILHDCYGIKFADLKVLKSLGVVQIFSENSLKKLKVYRYLWEKTGKYLLLIV